MLLKKLKILLVLCQRYCHSFTVKNIFIVFPRITSVTPEEFGKCKSNEIQRYRLSPVLTPLRSVSVTSWKLCSRPDFNANEQNSLGGSVCCVN